MPDKVDFPTFKTFDDQVNKSRRLQIWYGPGKANKDITYNRETGELTILNTEGNFTETTLTKWDVNLLKKFLNANI